MNINEYLEMTREVREIGGIDFVMLEVRPQVVCADGFSVSVQASEMTYCEPRLNHGPYSKVELGYPSAEVPEWMEYAEEEDKPTNTVYGWVPVEIVDAVLEQHGGIANEVE